MPFRSYSKKVYRNFATSIESQELVDDLTADPEKQAILRSFYYSEKSSKLPSPVERVLNKSERHIIRDEINSKFMPGHWYESRFSDGSSESGAVLYAAESEETALREVLFHMGEFYREELQKGDVIAHRRVVRLKVQSERCIEVLDERDPDLDTEALRSEDHSGYPYCQKLAQKWIRLGAALFRAPSARHVGGISTPLFQKEIVKSDEGHLKYLRCLLKSDGRVEVTGILEEEKRIYNLSVTR